MRFTRALQQPGLLADAGHVSDGPDSLAARRAFIPRPEIHDGTAGLQHAPRIHVTRRSAARRRLRLRPVGQVASGREPHAVRRALRPGSPSPTATRPSSTTRTSSKTARSAKKPATRPSSGPKHGVKFIEQNKDRPFFLYPRLQRALRARRLDAEPDRRTATLTYYRGQTFRQLPRRCDAPLAANNKQFHNTQNAMERTPARSAASMTASAK